MGPDWSFERMTSSRHRHLRGHGSSFGSGGNSTAALGDNSVVLSLPESGGRGGMLLSKSMRSGGSTQGGFYGWSSKLGSGGNDCFKGIWGVVGNVCRHGDKAARPIDAWPMNKRSVSEPFGGPAKAAYSLSESGRAVKPIS